MRPLSIRLEGFGSWSSETYIDLSDYQIIAMVGHNGAGKSTLLDSMLWALYGQVRGGNADSWISTGSTRCTVEVVVSLASGDQMQVQRVRTSSGRTSLVVQTRATPDDPWALVGDGSVADGQRQINNLVGAPIELLLSSVWLKQGDAARFSEASPGNRRQILAEILSVDYSMLQTRAKEKVTILNAQLDKISSQIEGLANLADQQPALTTSLERAVAAVLDADRNVQEAEQQLDLAAQYRSAVEALADWERQKNQASTRVTQLTQQHRSALTARDRVVVKMEPDPVAAAAAQEQCTQISAELESAQQALNDLNTEGAGVNAHIQQYEERLAKLVELGDQCPTCLQQIDADVHQDLIDVSEAKLTEMRTHIESLRQQRSELKGRIEQISIQLAQQQALVNDLTQAAADRARWDELNGFYVQAETDLQEATRQLDEIMAAQPAPLEAEAVSVEAAQMSVERARDIHSGAVAERGRYEGQLQQAKEAAAQIERLRKDVEPVTLDLEATKMLVRAVSPAEIPTRMIESQLPVLEDHINHWLSRMSDGTMSLQLVTSKARSTGKGDVPTLDLMVAYRGTVRPYDTFSGGEKLKLDLACRLGISHLLAARSGTPIRFLVIDEGWGALDAEGIEALLGALEALQDQFELIVTITHVPAVAEAFPVRLEVERTGKGSAATLVDNTTAVL